VATITLAPTAINPPCVFKADRAVALAEGATSSRSRRDLDILDRLAEGSFQGMIDRSHL
jgi:hypothetical protein